MNKPRRESTDGEPRRDYRLRREVNWGIKDTEQVALTVGGFVIRWTNKAFKGGNRYKSRY